MTITDRRRAMMGAAKSDPYTWDKLFASIDAGTYATGYALGDLFPLKLGDNTIEMQIVGFNVDTISGTTSKAPVSMAALQVWPTTHRYNPAYIANTIGTGTLGGFENCELRTWMLNNIWTLIPSAVADRILAVDRITSGYDASEVAKSYTSSEKICIPSQKEFNSGNGAGTPYAYFTSNTKRIRYNSSGTAVQYRCRNAYSKTNTYMSKPSGKIDDTIGANNAANIVLLFCVGGAS